MTTQIVQSLSSIAGASAQGLPVAKHPLVHTCHAKVTNCFQQNIANMLSNIPETILPKTHCSKPVTWLVLLKSRLQQPNYNTNYPNDAYS